MHDDTEDARPPRNEWPERSKPLPVRAIARPCLRFNPLTGRAEPGHFTVHPADFAYTPPGDTGD
jgi:hypothetical protein